MDNLKGHIEYHLKAITIFRAMRELSTIFGAMRRIMHADNMKVIERECRKNIKACKNNLKMLKKLRKEDKRKPDTVQQGLRERVHRLLERHQDEEEGQEGSTGQFEV